MNTNTVHENPFIKLVKTPFGYYFYDANKNQIIKVNEKLYQYLDRILSGKTGETTDAIIEQYNYLKECGFLHESKVKRVKHPVSENLELYTDRKIDELILQITQSCNLRCAYCIYSEKNTIGQRIHTTKEMDYELAVRAVDYYFHNSIDSQRKVIAFYGGEPLLHFDLIKRIVAYVKTTYYGCDISFVMTTNATLLTESIIKYLIENNFGLMISLDGPQDVHDKHRKFSNETGSFKAVESNIDLLWKIDPDFARKTAINMVVDPENNYESISGLFTNKNIASMSISVSVVESNGVVNPSDKINNYVKGLNYYTFVKYMNAKRSNDDSSELSYIASDYLDNLDVTVKRLFKPTNLTPTAAPSGPCIPGRKRLFVNTEGIFFPCERVIEAKDVTAIGNIDTGINKINVNRILNITRNVGNRCVSCWAFSMCSLCIKGAVTSSGISKEKIDRACELSKQNAWSLLRYRILEQELTEKLSR